MSAAEKYGQIKDLPSETLSQAREAARPTRELGATQNETPAQKYSAPVARNEMGRSLSQQPPGRSL
jgi:hypothetical protein